MCDLINKRLEFTVSYSNWLSIVYHFLITSGNGFLIFISSLLYFSIIKFYLAKNATDSPNYWCIIDMMVQKICLYIPDGSTEFDKDKLDFKELLEK